MDIGMTSLGNLAKLTSGVRSKRWSSYDKTGGNESTSRAGGHTETEVVQYHAWNAGTRPRY